MRLRMYRAIKKYTAILTIASLLLDPVAVLAAAVADAAADPSRQPMISQKDEVTVVDIARPNERGLSHNIYTEFNVNEKGLILNNSLVEGNTTLAGMLHANPNLQEKTASIILNEVTGSDLTRLQGVLEIAGSQADLIIANPNGIAGNGFGFINAGRISLVTGIPDIDVAGNLNSFTVTGGETTIDGLGMLEEGSQPTRLDILTRAAKINAELWAEEINVVTGSNRIDYQTLQPDAIAGNEEKSVLALDIGSLGGMYAGKIKLIGTEKGLGVALSGDIYSEGDLTLTNEGKITVNASGSLHAVKDLQISAPDGAVVNYGQLSANENIVIQARSVNNSGFIYAGAEYEEDDEDDEDEPAAPGVVVPADLTIVADEGIFSTGILSASRNISLQAQKVKYNKDKVFAQQLQVDASDPDHEPEEPNPDPDPDPEPNPNPTPNPNPGSMPEPLQPDTPADPAQPGLPASPELPASPAAPLSPAGPQNPAGAQPVEAVNPQPAKPVAPDMAVPVVPDLPALDAARHETIENSINPAIPELPDLPELADITEVAGTQAAEKAQDLRIIADTTQPQYRPLHEKTANGVDLIQIAAPTANGVSRNLYTEFNIKPGGVIFNNYTRLKDGNQYVKTQLGGYVEYNSLLGVDTARVILNEVTSTKASTLNGFAEIAGDKASLVIANPNGISINGLGFINVDQVSLSTARVKSWQSGVIDYESAAAGDMLLQGDGLNALSANPLNLRARNLTNTASELWANQLSLHIDGQLTNSGKIIADQTLQIETGSLTNRESGLIAGTEQLRITVDGLLNNQEATLRSDGALDLQAGRLQNSDHALIHAGQNLTLVVEREVVNRSARIAADGMASIQGRSLTNSAGAAMLTGDTLHLAVEEAALNQASLIHSESDMTVRAQSLQNSDRGAVFAENDLDIRTGDAITNVASAISSGGQLTVAAAGLQNTGNAFIHSAGKLDAFIWDAVDNRRSVVQGLGGIQLRAKSFTNQDGAYLFSGGSLNLDLSERLHNQASTLKSAGDARIAAGDITNWSGAVLSGGGLLNLRASQGVNNRSSAILAGATLTLHAGTLSNQEQALLQSQQDMNIALQQEFNNTQSAVKSGADLSLTAAAVTSSGAQISAGGDGHITAQTIENTDQASLIIRGDSLLQSSRLTNRDHAKIGIAGNSRVETGELINDDVALYLVEGDSDITADNIRNSAQAALIARGDSRVQAKSLINEDRASLLVDGDSDLTVTGSIINQDNVYIGVAGDSRIESGSLTNAGNVTLITGGNSRIHTGDLINRDNAYIGVKGNSAINADSVVNQDTVSLILEGNSEVNAADAWTNQTNVSVSIGGDSSISTGQLINTDKSSLTIGGNSSIQTGGTFLNAGNATVGIKGDSVIRTGDLYNQSQAALIVEGASLLEAGRFSNQNNAWFSVRGGSDITAQQLNNADTAIISIGRNSVIRTTSLDNTRNALLSVGGDSALYAGTVRNAQQAAWLTGGNSHIVSGELRNQDNAIFGVKGSSDIVADSLHNAEQAQFVIEGDSVLTLESLTNQDNAVFGVKGDSHISAKQVANEQKARFVIEGDSLITAQDAFINRNDAVFGVRGGSDIAARRFINSDKAAFIVEADSRILAETELTNQKNAAISIGGDSEIDTQKLSNANRASLVIGGDSAIRATDSIASQDNAAIGIRGSSSMETDRFINSGRSELIVGKNSRIQAADTFINQDNATVGIKGGSELLTGSMTNAQQARFLVEGNNSMDMAGNLRNSFDAVISVKGDNAMQAKNLNNEGTAAIIVEGDNDMEIRETLRNQDNAAIGIKGDSDIRTGTFDSQDTVSFIVEGNSRIQANADFINSGNASFGVKGDSHIAAESFVSGNKAAFIVEGDSTVAATTFRNAGNASFGVKGDSEITATEFTNENRARLIVEGDSRLVAANALHNRNDAMLGVKGDSEIITQSLANTDRASLIAEGGSRIHTGSLQNLRNAYIGSGGNSQITADRLTNQHKASLTVGGDSTLTLTTDLINADNASIAIQGDSRVNAAAFVNQDTAGYTAGSSTIFTGSFTNRNHASFGVRGDSAITATGFDNSNIANFTVEGNSTIHVSGDLSSRDNARIGIKGDSEITAVNLIHEDTARLAVEGDSRIDAQNLTNRDNAELSVLGDNTISLHNNFLQRNASLFGGGSLTITADKEFLNESALIAAGGAVDIQAESIANRQDAIIYAGGDMALTAQGGIVNRSSGLESQGDIRIRADRLTNDKSVFRTEWNVSQSNIGQQIPYNHVANAYNGFRRFDRETHTAVIVEEAPSAHILADGDIDMVLGSGLLNHYSTIAAGNNLAITAPVIENHGYQGTVIDTDTGTDSYDWKYKKKRKWYKSSKWIYGTTVVPYYEYTVTLQNSSRLGLLSGVNQVTLHAGSIDNKTFDAGGNELDYAAPVFVVAVQDKTRQGEAVGAVGAAAAAKNVDSVQSSGSVAQTAEIGSASQTASIGQTLQETQLPNQEAEPVNAQANAADYGKAAVAVGDSQTSTIVINPDAGTLANGFTLPSLPANRQIYTINSDPTATYLVETNPKFTNLQQFISSDYMLDRIKSNPEKVMKRLGDGYYEQSLVIDQITQLTGKRFLDGYTSAMDQYKALMENAVTYADEFGLIPGVALSREQMAALTSDIVWLVERTVNGETVLVPEVYLANLKERDLNPTGAVIAGGDIEIFAKETLDNIGLIKADRSLDIGAGNVFNQNGAILGETIGMNVTDTLLNQSAVIAGNDITISAGTIANITATETGGYRELTEVRVMNPALISAANDLTLQAADTITNYGAGISAGNDLSLTAANGIDIGSVAAEKHIAVTAHSTSYAKDRINWQQSQVSGKNVAIETGDLSIKGASVSATEDIRISATGDISITAEKDLDHSDITVGSRSGSFFNREMTSDETLRGGNISAGQNVSIESGGDIQLKGSNIQSESGAIELTADGSVSIEGDQERHETITESKRTKSGTFSKKVTTKRDHELVNAVVESSVSGDSVAITAQENITVKAGAIVGDNEVSLAAGNDIRLESLAETGASEHYKHTKKSGLFSGGGLGFTIGSRKETSTVNENVLAEIGSTIGSLDGNVSLTAGNNLTSSGSSLIAGKDLDISGKSVTIDNTIDTYDSNSRYEVKQSGLSVSLGGSAVDAGINAVNHIERASEVSDNRLQALYGFKAQQDIKELGNQLKGNGDGISLNVSIGSSKSSTEQTVHMETVNSSDIKAGGNVSITAREGNADLTAVNIDANNISINAAQDINLGAAQNQYESNIDSKTSSWALGASFGTNTSYFGSISKGSGKENEKTTTNQGSSLDAKDTLTLVSGNDLNITGSQAAGEKVVAEVGGDLNIASLQDTEEYKASSKNSGFGFDIGQKVTNGKKESTGGVIGSTSKSKTDSTYASVTDQAGIHAGTGGFDIEVGGNTDLKGAVIASEADADKNRLSTDTLTYSDIENKAEYSSSSVGVNLDTKKDTKAQDAGLTPAIGTKAADEADSTTKAAIAEGTIEVRSGNSDLSNLSRDTANALNALDQIFDKKTVEEQQELARVFGEVAFKAIGDLDLKEGSPEKAAIDAVVGGIMAKLGGGDALSGAVGGGLNQLVMNELAKIDDPAVMQWASIVLGAAAAKMVGGDAQTGASVAASETKNNSLTHKQYAKYIRELAENQKALQEGKITPEQAQEKEQEITRRWANIAQSQNGELASTITDSNVDELIDKIKNNEYIYDSKLESYPVMSPEEARQARHTLLQAAGAIPGLSVAVTAGEVILYVGEGNNEAAVKELALYVGTLGLGKQSKLLKMHPKRL